MKTQTKVILGLVGLTVIGIALSPAKPTEPAQQTAIVPESQGKLRTDIFGSPAPATAHGNEPLRIVATNQPPPWPKDEEGNYEIDIPAGMGGGGLHRLGQELRRLLKKERGDADAGIAMSVGVYEVWRAGTKNKVVQLVYGPDTVKQLLNTPGWLNAAVENIPDLAGAKTVANINAYVEMCRDVLAADEGRQVAGEQFCTR